MLHKQCLFIQNSVTVALCLALALSSPISKLSSPSSLIAQSSPNSASKKQWHSNAEVARKTIHAFEELQSYQADFYISVSGGKTKRSMSGKVYYQKPGKIRYQFTNPYGNLIVSDSKLMWLYIKKINTVGKQVLRSGKQVDGDPVFKNSPLNGIKRLFLKYHYRFDSPEQPRKIPKKGNAKYFVFNMEQREKSGGFEKMKIYIHAKTHLVHSATGTDSYGKKAKIRYSNIRTDKILDGSLFQYKPKSSTEVVLNPLVPN